MEATLQALQALPEENYQVLRFLVAFLVQVRPGPLRSARRRAGEETTSPPLLVMGSRVRGFLLEHPNSLHRFLPTVTRTR